MSTSDHSNANWSFILPEGGALTAWLHSIDTLITRGIGGILAERGNDPSGFRDVLDLGCGVGGWAMAVASCSADIKVVGVDINEHLMSYAQMDAQGRGLDNVRFQIMDVRQPLEFPDNSFDLVNASTFFSSLSPADWPPLLRECARILRPGCILRLMELERAITNSPALEQFWDLYARALFVDGRSFSHDGKRIGIAVQMGRLLHEAGFQNIERQVHTPEFSSWAPGHHAWQEHTLITQTLLESFLVKSGVATREELARIREQEKLDMLSPDFCGLAHYYTAWGTKPV
ncbi:MAG TPA: class I SAM-dependent methyltransferase [Ktedonobacteraceae bacterium]|jgi:ubiquinone/menaquinone biosynthesis C-methylase UbiE|nr:class I SAM-dependent methyltransferase [Ktedonobacteraceae bacterium]